MSPERAAFILSKSKFGSLPYNYKVGQNNITNSNFDAEGITIEEDSYIRKLWKFLPGSFSYVDVLLSIKNKHLNNSYYCYAFKKDESSGAFKQVLKDFKEKELDDLNREAVNYGLSLYEDSRKYLPLLIEKWNLSQPKDNDLIWYYSLDELSENEVLNILKSIYRF